MARGLRSLLLSAMLAILAGACAPAPSPVGTPDGGGAAAGTTGVQRTLVVINRAELPSIAAKPIVGFSGSLARPVDLFNATLDFTDERGVSHPYLAEALPQLNTDSWRVHPDGRMETTYPLRPNLTWHDGTALDAEDFVFAWRVYATPEHGVAKSPPIRDMDEVQAADSRTVTIRWRRLYADAAHLADGFRSLPRHILQEPLQRLSHDEFANLAFWSSDYVGLGPYRLLRWESGVSIEGAAFDGHALGRPKIDRVRVVFIGDPNTALANLLAGEAHYLGPFVMGVPEGEALQRQWEDRGAVLYAPVQIRLTQIQMRPDVANPRELADVRVRRALAHAFDAPSAIDGLTAGKGILTHTLTSPLVDFYPAIEPVIARYPYDPRRAQQLLEQIGFARGADGFYLTPAGQPFRFDIFYTSSGKNERENTVHVDSLRRAGIDASGRGMPREQLDDPRTRALTTGMFMGSVGSTNAFAEYTSAGIPSAENRWQGRNRLGWSNPEYDRLFDAFSVALDRSERIALIAQMERVWTGDVASIPHYFDPVVIAHVAGLKGPVAQVTPDGGSGFLRVHTWEWTS